MKLKVSGNQVVQIIDNSPESGVLFADEDVVQALNESFAPVVAFAHDVLEEVKQGVKPSELEITFGAEAGAEGGFFGIARAHAKATVLVKMKWNAN